MPVMIYGHPGENISKKTGLLREIYKKADSLDNVWKARMSDVAGWWAKRCGVNFEKACVDLERSVFQYEAQSSGDLSGISLYIERRDGSVLFSDISKGMGDAYLNDKSVERRMPLKAPAQPYKEAIWKAPLARKTKNFIIDLIDWEKDTPPEKIERRDMASYVKYCLRKIKS